MNYSTGGTILCKTMTFFGSNNGSQGAIQVLHNADGGGGGWGCQTEGVRLNIF